MDERPSRWHRSLAGLREGFMGRALITLLVLAVLAASAWVFRRPLLRSAAFYLVREDAPTTADALYVLGGAPMERGARAVELWRAGIAPVMVFTGANIPASRDVACEVLTEAQLTARVALGLGADSASVVVLSAATSTWEEAAVVRRHARANGHRTIVVLSTDLHLRRVGYVFRKRFAGTGIAVKLRAAPGRNYVPRHWWRSEDGVIMLTNEYTKLVYYWLKY